MKINIVIISPEATFTNKRLKNQLNAKNITILSDLDTDLKIITEYGVLDTKSPTAKIFHSIKKTAKPSTFIVDENQTIIYKQVGSYYFIRPKIKKIIQEISS